MSDVQVIEKDGVPAFYVLPAALWLKVREAVEDAEDAADIDRFDRQDDGTRIPLAVVKAQLDDGSHPRSHPVKAWREHRGLTVQQLASATGLSKPFVSQIETGRRVGTAATLKKLAQALGTTVQALLP